jgi:hypothetical protein
MAIYNKNIEAAAALSQKNKEFAAANQVDPAEEKRKRDEEIAKIKEAKRAQLLAQQEAKLKEKAEMELFKKLEVDRKRMEKEDADSRLIENMHRENARCVPESSQFTLSFCC